MRQSGAHTCTAVGAERRPSARSLSPSPSQFSDHSAQNRRLHRSGPILFVRPAVAYKQSINQMRCAMFVTVAAAGCSALITPPMQASVHRTRAPSMLLPLIDSGKPGMNIRPYDKLLNFAAPYVVPLLVEKGSVLFKPLYKVYRGDMVW